MEQEKKNIWRRHHEVSLYFFLTSLSGAVAETEA